MKQKKIYENEGLGGPGLVHSSVHSPLFLSELLGRSHNVDQDHIHNACNTTRTRTTTYNLLCKGKLD